MKTTVMFIGFPHHQLGPRDDSVSWCRSLDSRTGRGCDGPGQGRVDDYSVSERRVRNSGLKNRDVTTNRELDWVRG